MKRIASLLLVCFLALSCSANIVLSSILSDGMVLQHGKPIKLWGECDAGEKIRIDIAGRSISTTGKENKTWEVWLPALKPGGPYEMTIKGNNLILIKDILAGEVWVCSGQSNMEWPVQLTKDAGDELKDADYPLIRQFEVEKKVSLQPLQKLEYGKWVIASPATAGRFSAVGFFFAKKIFRELKIPIGIINASVGGTILETWMSRKAMGHTLFENIAEQIPDVNIATLLAEKETKLLQRINKVQAGLPTQQQIEQWKTVNFNDDNWPLIKVPAFWETQGWQELNGKVWYRTSVTLTAGEANKQTKLFLGKIDDSDSVWINGVFIGSMKNKPVDERIYNIPANLLKPGSNIIVVAIEDYGGGGGFTSNATSVCLQMAEKKIDLTGNWKYNISYANQNSYSIYPNDYPTLLFNAMIHPLHNYIIKGVLWYQGESNTARAEQYRKAFPLMIKDWRSLWNQPRLPFGFVQLASFNANTDQPGKGSAWAELRASQAAALHLPATGMVVTIDVGERNDIHPRNKQVVGHRLAAWALHKVYKKFTPYNLPTYAGKKTEGSFIRVYINNAGSHLIIKDSTQNIKGFWIASSGNNFIRAYAKREGKDIIVFHPDIKHPADVRYAWEDDAGDANVCNAWGLPLVPFATDQRPFLTKGITYKIGM